jgi:arylsulfatase A-like enzyme
VLSRFLPLSLIALVLGLVAPAGAGAQPRPNILVIVTDDQPATGTLPVMPETLAFFAEAGTRFVNAFAPTPLCSPGRASILTGRYAHNTGVRGNGAASRARLDQSTLFPRLLNRAGYETGFVGKFLNAWPIGTPPPHFDRWATLDIRRPYRNSTFNVNGRVRREHGYSTDVMTRHAVSFLRAFDRRADRAPWFLLVAPAAAHAPWQAPQRHRSAAVPAWEPSPAVGERNRSDKPPYIRTENFTQADAAIVRRRQLRTLMAVDDMVARISRTLEELGETRRTLAIFTSDNGFIWGDHRFGGEFRQAGNKRVPYTASVTVPLLLRWPGHVAAGRVDSRPAATIDIAPTVLAAARLRPEWTIDGRSLLSGQRRRRILLEYWHDVGVPTWASLRTPRLQYVEYYAPTGRRTFGEYYDLARDRWQLRNLLHDGTPANDPPLTSVSRTLQRLRLCAGHRPAVAIPCP